MLLAVCKHRVDAAARARTAISELVRDYALRNIPRRGVAAAEAIPCAGPAGIVHDLVLVHNLRCVCAVLARARVAVQVLVVLDRDVRQAHAAPPRVPLAPDLVVKLCMGREEAGGRRGGGSERPAGLWGERGVFRRPRVGAARENRSTQTHPFCAFSFPRGRALCTGSWA